MTKTHVLAILAMFLALWVGMECGYRIGHQAGFDACQEQF